jgi:hypothetical protein
MLVIQYQREIGFDAARVRKEIGRPIPTYIASVRVMLFTTPGIE